jgi:hypothetical protein
MTPTTLRGVRSRNPASGPSVFSATMRPTMPGSAWKYRRHAPALRTTTPEPAASSRASSVRPSTVRPPSMPKTLEDTSAPVKRAEPAEVGIKVIGGVSAYAMADSVVVRARHSLNSVHVMPVLRPGGVFALRAGSRSTIRTKRSLSGYGSGRSNTALTTLKTAVVAPIPSASVTTAAVANPGLRARPRAA